MARRFHNRLPGPDIATRSIRGRNRATTDPRAAIDHHSARFAGAWVGYLARGLLISLGFVVVPQPPANGSCANSDAAAQSIPEGTHANVRRSSSSSAPVAAM